MHKLGKHASRTEIIAFANPDPTWPPVFPLPRTPPYDRRGQKARIWFRWRSGVFFPLASCEVVELKLGAKSSSELGGTWVPVGFRRPGTARSRSYLMRQA